MLVSLARFALAADPAPAEIPPERIELEALRKAHDRTVSEVEFTRRELENLLHRVDTHDNSAHPQRQAA